MKDFEEWAKSLPKWSEKLLELGASWDTFRRETEEVIADLVKGGIPLLPAKDIVDKAREIIQSRSAPMAIFWDLDTIAFPSGRTGREVISSLKFELSHYGVLTQLRGYASNSIASIPEQHRCEMIEGGCMLVDSPSGGKEIASKRIIIDSLKFAYERTDRATICLVTADPDVTHLLSALESNQLSTILISNEVTLLRMHDAVCGLKLNWESDILHLRHSDGGKEDDTQRSSSINGASSCIPTDSKVDDWNGKKQRNENTSKSGHEPKPLSKQDSEFLRAQIVGAAIDLGNGQKHSALKSRVGSLLRLADPGRFPTRDDLAMFLAAAVDAGLVVESGYGEYKILTLVGPDGHFPSPPLEITKITPPLTNKDLPRKVIELSKIRPYIIFVPWSECVNRETFPNKAFVHTTNRWAMLMFESLIHAQQAAIEFPWLSSGHLIDWRRVGNEKFPSKPFSSQTRGETFAVKTPYESRYKRDEKADVEAVVSVMEMLLTSDEIYVAEPVLRYQLASRRDGNTADKLLYVWIEDAVRAGLILLFRRPGVPKGRFYCLPNQLDNSRAACSLVEFDTSEEENHVVNLITTSQDKYVTRNEIIESLKTNFPRMESPWMRVKVFQNGARKGIFFVAKDGSTQIVGFTKEDAQRALRLLKNTNGEIHPEQQGTFVGSAEVNTSASEAVEPKSASTSPPKADVNGAL